MSNTLQLLKEFCRSFFVTRNEEQGTSLLTRDVSWLGNTASEDVHSLEEARAYIAKGYGISREHCEMEITGETFMPLGDCCGTAVLRLRITTAGITSFMNANASSKEEDGIEKLCTLQFAVIDTMAEPGEDYLVTKNRTKLAKERKELILSTLAGGMMGGYMKPGFPLYFIDSAMLEYLGYGSEKEFSEDIDGLVTNVMHPEDRAMVDSEVERQLSKNNQYVVDYRMRKKDSSYIWVHDIGRKTKSETDEDVIISVCYDITEDHFKQAQMDNLIDAIPGGVALYRIENGNIETLYQSSGFKVLIGSTPKEYAEYLQAEGLESIYKEDKERVISAVHEAADSNKTISLDFRVLHKSGGYIWISGSYRKTSEENGSPIVQAVFTQMPQMQELMNDVVENSGVFMIVSDYETHELLYLNQATLSAIGKVGKEYEGKICHEFLLGSSNPCVFCKQLRLDLAPEKRMENYIPEMDHYYMTQGRLVNWAGRVAHIEYMTDITDLKKAQKTMEEMLNSIACGIYISKISMDRTAHIEYVNDGLCRLFECSKDELIRNMQADTMYAVHPDDKEKLNETVQCVNANQTDAQSMFRIVMPDGRIKWIRLDIQLIMHSDGTASAYVTYNDNTYQQQQEQQLRNVLSNVPGGVCLYRWDGVKIQPLIVSESFSELLGADAARRLQASNGLIFQNVHPDDQVELDCAIRNAIANHVPLKHAYRALNGKTNEYFWLFCNAITVPQDDGSTFVYASYTDITDERKTTQELVASETALDIAAREAGLWYWKYEPAYDRAYCGDKLIQDFGLPAVGDNYPESWMKYGVILPAYQEIYCDAVAQIKAGKQQVVFEAQVKLRDVVHWGEFRMTRLPQVKGEESLVVCTARVIDY